MKIEKVKFENIDRFKELIELTLQFQTFNKGYNRML
jgi:hypothetical protein